MRPSKAAKFLLFCFMIIVFPLNGHSGEVIKDTSPGKYLNWNDSIDELEIVRAFKLSDFARLIILPLDTSKAIIDMDEETEKTFLEIFPSISDLFIKGIKKSLKNITIIKGLETDPISPRSLLFKGKVHRIFAGFVSSSKVERTAVQIRGELIDSHSKEVLFKFRDRKSSWVRETTSTKGTFKDHIIVDIQDIGEVLGNLLENF